LQGMGWFAEYVWKDGFFMENANLLKAPAYGLVNLNVHCDCEINDAYLMVGSPTRAPGRERRVREFVFLYVLMTVSGLSLAALLCTTNALLSAVVLSFRARCIRSAGIIAASPSFRSVFPRPSISTVRLPSIT
jgi:hypothetical protein